MKMKWTELRAELYQLPMCNGEGRASLPWQLKETWDLFTVALGLEYDSVSIQTLLDLTVYPISVYRVIGWSKSLAIEHIGLSRTMSDGAAFVSHADAEVYARSLYDGFIQEVAYPRWWYLSPDHYQSLSHMPSQTIANLRQFWIESREAAGYGKSICR